MMRTRTAMIIAGSALLAAGLTACDKPNPGATVFSGTTSSFRQAACWAHDSSSIDMNACAQQVAGAGEVGSIPVVPGAIIGISVDPVVADEQWQFQLDGQVLPATRVSSTYFRFKYPDMQEVPAKGSPLQIVAGKDGKIRGIWIFQIVPAS